MKKSKSRISQPKHFLAKVYYMSREGVQALHRKQKKLRSKRIDISHELSELNNQPASNTVEDQAWLEAMNELQYVENELEMIDRILARVKLIRRPRRLQHVTLGSRVRLQKGKHQLDYTIVGSVEANPTVGKISDESPVGKALLGKKVGDQVTLASKQAKAKPLVLKLAQIE